MLRDGYGRILKSLATVVRTAGIEPARAKPEGF
jgi:hypothetical protein